MKKLRRILKAAWRNARTRLEAVPAVVWLARWLGALTPVGWSVSVALIAGAIAAGAFGWIEGFVVAVMGLVALVVLQFLAGLWAGRDRYLEDALDN